MAKNTKDIEKLTHLKSDLEQKIGYINSEKANLVSFKETFPYVLRESLKFVMPEYKNSTLKHSLKNLEDDDSLKVRSVFKDLGLDLKF